MSEKNPEPESWLAQWSEKYQEPIDELKKLYEKKLAEIKKKLPDLTAKEHEKMARKQLRGIFKRRALSTAERFVGFVTGVSPPLQMHKRKYDYARQVWNIDQQQAIDEQLCDKTGTPIDGRPKYKSGADNPNYLQPLDLEAYIFNVFGFYAKYPLTDEDKLEFQPFALSVSNEQANPNDKDFVGGSNIPLFKPIEFYGIIKQNAPKRKDGIIEMNASKLPSWKPWTPPNGTALANILTDMKNQFIPIKKIKSWTKKLPGDDYSAFCIVQCDALRVDRTISQYGSWTLHIDDESLDEVDLDPIKCYVPSFIPNDTFANGSRLLVCGRPKIGTKNDPSALTMNVNGIFAIPKYKIEPPQTKEVTAKTTNIPEAPESPTGEKGDLGGFDEADFSDFREGEE